MAASGPEPVPPDPSGNGWDGEVARAIERATIPPVAERGSEAWEQPTWDEQAGELLGLQLAAAIAKGVAVRTHAQAYLAADGPGVQQEQVARLAAAGAVLAADVARARVEAYRLIIDAHLTGQL